MVRQQGPIDPASFRFGGTEDGEKDGVAKTFNPALAPDYKRPAVVVEKRLEDFRELNAEGWER